MQDWWKFCCSRTHAAHFEKIPHGGESFCAACVICGFSICIGEAVTAFVRSEVLESVDFACPTNDSKGRLSVVVHTR